MTFRTYGGEEVLELTELPTPRPGPGEVRVGIRAAGVNHLDLDLRAGRSRYSLVLPHVLGRECAGIVDAVGAGVTSVQPGQRVLVATSAPCGACTPCRRGEDNRCPDAARPGVTTQGGYAEAIVVPQGALLPIGQRLDFVAAAALPVAFGTAWHMLVTLAQLRAGETVLVNGAGGGLGAAGVQVAALCGARVIASAGSPAKLAAAARMGATTLVDYHADNLTAAVLRATGGSGVDVAFDHIGGDVFTATLACTAEGGRVVTAGAHAGEVVALDLVPFFRGERRLYGARGQRREELETVVALAVEGRLQAVVGRVLPLAQAAEAHRLLDTRAVLGKVVLEP